MLIILKLRTRRGKVYIIDSEPQMELKAVVKVPLIITRIIIRMLKVRKEKRIY
jgi:hypothetical protein